jgi:ABC-type uncharacterized transport system substrate-binding protein
MAKVIRRLLLVIAILLGPYLTHAQQSVRKLPRVGILTTGIAPSIHAFRQGLHHFGWVEGKNIEFEHRSANGNEERLPAVAAQLVAASVDIILSTSLKGTLAIQQVTTNVPVVTTFVGDRIRNLGRPDGNVTGLSSMPRELGGKRLELLKETVPIIARVAVLTNIDNQTQATPSKAISAVSRSLGVQIQMLNVTKPEEIENAFASMVRGKADAVMVQTPAMFVLNRARIVELAAKSRLPTIYPDSRFTDAGGLMSYGPNDAELYRRAAYFVDRILKGAKPAELPVEQPTKFELVINLKTAEALGLTIPPKVLMWADKVIE